MSVTTSLRMKKAYSSSFLSSKTYFAFIWEETQFFVKSQSTDAQWQSTFLNFHISMTDLFGRSIESDVMRSEKEERRLSEKRRRILYWRRNERKSRFDKILRGGKRLGSEWPFRKKRSRSDIWKRKRNLWWREMIWRRWSHRLERIRKIN